MGACNDWFLRTQNDRLVYLWQAVRGPHGTLCIERPDDVSIKADLFDCRLSKDVFGRVYLFECDIVCFVLQG